MCLSCGINTTEKYCDKCNTERLDPTVRPLVWEYIGGKRGSLPNRRGPIMYTLKDMGYTLQEKINGLLIYAHELTGKIALVTTDQYIVIVNDTFELVSLLSHPCGFSDNPILKNLPGYIESLYPERADIVAKIQKDAGIT